MAKDSAIVLNNGGMNSAVATALAAQKYRTVLLYAEIAPQPGSRTRGAYDQQVAHFKPYREHTLSMPFLSDTARTRPAPTQASDPRQPNSAGPQLLALLPLIAAAAGYAAHYQATAIYLGLRVGSDSRGTDRAAATAGAGQPAVAEVLAQATEFVQIWNELLEHPCGRPDLTVETPLLELELWQIVDVGFQAHVPFERTWSCLEEGGEPCWACRGCRTRESAFQQAGKPDPLRVVRKS